MMYKSVRVHLDCSTFSVLFVVFMNRILRHSCGEEDVWFGNLRLSPLLFANDVLLELDQEMDQRIWALSAVVWIIHRKKVTDPKDKALNLVIYLHSTPHMKYLIHMKYVSTT